jgi:O-antigen/teichoic acid export membrane protein
VAKIVNPLKMSWMAGVGTYLKVPLIRNAYALILSSASTSSLGMLFWVLAARYYSPEIVGLNSAAISAMQFLTSISMLSQDGGLVRFIPVAGGKTRQLVNRVFLTVLATAFIAGLIFMLGLDWWAPQLSLLIEDWPVKAGFILALMSWCIFTLEDSVMAGLRESVWVPLKNITFALAKILLLVALAGFWRQYGIFAAWLIGAALVLFPAYRLITGRLIPRRAPVAMQTEDSSHGSDADQSLAKEFNRYLGGNYPASLLLAGFTSLLPVLVTELAGAKANAFFYPPWMIAIAIQLISINIAISFTVEATIDRQKLGLYTRRVLTHNLRLFIPLALVLLVAAPYLLMIFGPDYAAEGTDLLRLLALSLLPNSIVWLFIGTARVKNHPLHVVLVQGSLCVLVLGSSYLLLQVEGITGVGIAWLLSQVLLASYLYLVHIKPIISGRSR